MKPEHLFAFYEYALLPQFGIENQDISWHGSSTLGPDESAHHFSVANYEYILIFEDYDGLGRSPKFISETLALPEGQYIFVTPKAYTDTPPSLHFAFDTPFKYAPDITGTFTLIKLQRPSMKDDNAIHLGIKNEWGWVEVSKSQTPNGRHTKHVNLRDA